MVEELAGRGSHISERLACRLVGLVQSSLRRPLNGGTAADPDRALRAWLRAYECKHTRRGFRRAHVQARNDGWLVNPKKIQRLRSEGGLRVVVKCRQKRTGVSDLPAITKARAPGDVWAVDFRFHINRGGRTTENPVRH